MICQVCENRGTLTPTNYYVLGDTVPESRSIRDRFVITRAMWILHTIVRRYLYRILILEDVRKSLKICHRPALLHCTVNYVCLYRFSAVTNGHPRCFSQYDLFYASGRCVQIFNFFSSAVIDMLDIQLRFSAVTNGHHRYFSQCDFLYMSGWTVVANVYWKWKFLHMDGQTLVTKPGWSSQ